MKNSTSQYLYKKEVKSLFLEAQGFNRNRMDESSNKEEQIKKIMNTLHVLQLDSIPIVTRTQYFPAFSRLGQYEHHLLNSIAYEKDLWFECWAHEASLIPVEYEPLFRWSKARVQEGHTWKSLYRFAKKEQQFIDEVYLNLKNGGRLRAKDFEDQRRMPKSSWGGRRYTANALDWLFRVGKVGIRRVGNFEKEFDCIENIVPKKVLKKKTPSINEAIKQLLLFSIQALALATEDEIVDYFRLPPKLAKPILKELHEDKKIEAWKVESWKKAAYAFPSLPSINDSSKCEPTALLSPFDPVVWHRPRTERLFDFHYRIEIYVPKEKRRWGYYVLPFLMEGNLVARVDVKADKKNKVLVVPSAFIEKEFKKAKVAQALAQELKCLSLWLNLDKIEVGNEGDLSKFLKRCI